MNQITPKDEESVTIGPNSKLRLGLAISIAGGLMWVGWVTNELNTIKAAMVGKNDTIRGVEITMKILERRMDDLETRGSKPMQELQRSIDHVAEELRVHEATSRRLLNQNEGKQ